MDESRGSTGKSQTTRRPTHRILAALWFALFAAFVIVSVYPVGYRFLRIFIIADSLILWLGAAFLFRKHKRLVFVILAPGLIASVFILLPGRAVNSKRLEELYVRHLRRYNEARYLWGGENRFGIDCSGLVRRARITALAELGVRTLNPEPLRKALALWWYDCSARALRDEYRGFTSRMLTAPSVNSIDDSCLPPGSIAVTSDGIHVLAYIGDLRWIEADPGLGKVVKISVPSDNKWFAVPVQVLRWSEITLAGNI